MLSHAWASAYHVVPRLCIGLPCFPTRQSSTSVVLNDYSFNQNWMNVCENVTFTDNDGVLLILNWHFALLLTYFVASVFKMYSNRLTRKLSTGKHRTRNKGRSILFFYLPVLYFSLLKFDALPACPVFHTILWFWSFKMKSCNFQSRVFVVLLFSSGKSLSAKRIIELPEQYLPVRFFFQNARRANYLSFRPSNRVHFKTISLHYIRSV